MKIKDKVYDQHVAEQTLDRPKEFNVPLSETISTEEYVRRWCAKNGLKHNTRALEQRCKCGKPCAYYGYQGGYSVKCVDCNAKNAARQRAKRKK